ncbi:MAG TPA: universal stress protein [Acidobacteriota bacterium]|nr:universal stress protein [Acidobacteriota bacterium]
MHFLICIGGEEQSRGTLRFGLAITSALRADATILYVRRPVSSYFRKEAQLARQKLQNWPVETVDSAMMKAIERMLVEEGFVRMIDGRVDVRHMPRAEKRGLYEYHVYGQHGENVRIREREGDVVDSIRRETLDVAYDLVIVGAPGDGGRLVRQIIQYIEPSVLIVKNPRDVQYRLLLCLNNSESARRAQDFALRSAVLLNTSVDVLCIHSYPWEENTAMTLGEDAARLLKRFRVPHTIRIRRGPVVRTILREAQPDHLIVMGPSERSPIYQFLFGSVPVEIGRRGNNPVLVVK